VLSLHFLHVAFARWAGRPLEVGEKLSDVERMMGALALVQDAPQRLEALLLGRTIPARLQQLHHRIAESRRSYEVVMEAEDLSTLLALVRLISNTLNGGGLCKGFCLSTLRCLAFTRCTEVNATLLDFVACLAAAKRGDADDVRGCLSGALGVDLRALHARLSTAAVPGEEELNTELQLLTSQLHSLSVLVPRLREGQGDSESAALALQLAECRTAMGRASEAAMSLQQRYPGGNAAETLARLKAFVSELKEAQPRANVLINRLSKCNLGPVVPGVAVFAKKSADC